MGQAALAAVATRNSAALTYQTMRFDFCLTTKSASVPVGPDWLHEIKYDGYRFRPERDGLITRGGYNWTDRYPWIVESALKNRHRQFVMTVKPSSSASTASPTFDALHSGKHNEEVPAGSPRGEQSRPSGPTVAMT
jgi:ATP-dependent DNA ligase